jgi:hypothetical protein
MALQNLHQYGCQTGNKLKEKSRDLNRNSSRNKNKLKEKSQTLIEIKIKNYALLSNIVSF